MHCYLWAGAAVVLEKGLLSVGKQLTILDPFCAVHPFVVRGVVLLTKRWTEVLHVLRTTALLHQFDCFLLEEHQAEFTNRHHNCCAAIWTTFKTTVWWLWKRMLHFLKMLWHRKERQHCSMSSRPHPIDPNDYTLNSASFGNFCLFAEFWSVVVITVSPSVALTAS